MKLKAPENLSSKERICFYDCEENKRYYQYGTAGGWKKYAGNPVFGGVYETCFDVSLLLEHEGSSEQVFKMWFSWRPKRAIGYTESTDGIHWKEPVVVLKPVEGSDWEADEINRPSVIYKDGTYQMWYSGQMHPYMEDGRSVIGFAESEDGIHWKRKERPVMEPGQPWEKQAIMCPHVLFDEEDKYYKMWYAAGEQFEPDVLCYAESKDGINWERYANNPILEKSNEKYDQCKVGGCDILKENDRYYMFYIGYQNVDTARVCMAESNDGIHNWVRSMDNPVISPEKKSWDADAVYKPTVVLNKQKNKLLMWYNGRKQNCERIGLAEYRIK